jgi:hypothetical protein
MKRIGRRANPAEAGLQWILENPHMRDHVAENLYLHEAGAYTLDNLERFRALPEEERERWKARAIQLCREHTANYAPPTDPDDPDPGMPRLPDEVTRVA